MSDEIKIDLANREANLKKKQEESLAGLLALGKKKPTPKPMLNISASGDNTDGFSWGVMDDFLESYDRGNTDTNSLRWAFLSMIATIKGRDCWVNFGGKALYPNMYTALVGSPGCGKSTAIMIAKDLMDELGYPAKSPEIVDPSKIPHYFSEEYKSSRVDALPVGDGGTVVNNSAKALFLENFNKDNNDPHMAFDISERHSSQQLITRARLEELDHDSLGIISSELMGTIPPNSKWFVNKILIDLYDAHDHATYEVAEGVVLNKPIMNLLGGITASGLAESFKVSDFNTGLLTRITLVHSKDVEKGSPWDQDHDYKASTELLNKLKEIYDFKGEMKISSNAKKTYALITTTQHNTDYDIRLSFYYNRRSSLLTKVSMIIALLNGRDVISRSDMITANTLLLYTEFDMPKTLTDFGNTANIKIRNAIIDYLEKQLHKSTTTSSADIIENVSARLGLSRDNIVVTQLQKLVSTDLVTSLELGSIRVYHLNKPKNTDILEASKVKVADVKAIPEWNITSYALEDEAENFGDLEL